MELEFLLSYFLLLGQSIKTDKITTEMWVFSKIMAKIQDMQMTEFLFVCLGIELSPLFIFA